MPPDYLCEGSIWLNSYNPDGRFANIALVPHLHKSDAHHNFWLYWTDLDGTKGSEDRIPGHQIPVDELVAVSISCGLQNLRGIIKVKNDTSKERKE